MKKVKLMVGVMNWVTPKDGMLSEKGFDSTVEYEAEIAVTRKTAKGFTKLLADGFRPVLLSRPE